MAFSEKLNFSTYVFCIAQKYHLIIRITYLSFVFHVKYKSTSNQIYNFFILKYFPGGKKLKIIGQIIFPRKFHRQKWQVHCSLLGEFFSSFKDVTVSWYFFGLPYTRHCKPQLVFFYPFFTAVCRLVGITDNSCTKVGNYSIFEPKIRSL